MFLANEKVAQEGRCAREGSRAFASFGGVDGDMRRNERARPRAARYTRYKARYMRGSNTLLHKHPQWGCREAFKGSWL